MEEIRYVVRHSNGKSWACDKLVFFANGTYYIRENIRYFPTREEAEQFKKRKLAKGAKN